MALIQSLMSPESTTFKAQPPLVVALFRSQVDQVPAIIIAIMISVTVESLALSQGDTVKSGSKSHGTRPIFSQAHSSSDISGSKSCGSSSSYFHSGSGTKSGGSGCSSKVSHTRSPSKKSGSKSCGSKSSQIHSSNHSHNGSSLMDLDLALRLAILAVLVKNQVQSRVDQSLAKFTAQATLIVALVQSLMDLDLI